MRSRKDHPANIVLMGMRASGKSTVGRILAARLNRPFVDLDCETLAAFDDCRSVSEVWRTHGEAQFRAAELAALKRVLRSNGQVIALGGGTVATPEGTQLVDRFRHDADLMAIYLHASPDLLQRRLMRDAGDRPALRGGDAIEEVTAVLRERESTYRRLADFALDAALPPEEQVEVFIQSMDNGGRCR